MAQGKRIYTLNKKRDFEILKKKGRRLKKNFFFIIYRNNQLSYSRVAWVFPRWTGKAVLRNRFKRWGRDVLKKHQYFSGQDLLVGFEKRERSFYREMKYKVFCYNLEEALQCIS